MTVSVIAFARSQANDGTDPGVVIDPVRSPTQALPAVSAAPTLTPTVGPQQLRGFVFPIAGACLPQGQQLMPNAPRPYRNGIHEGVDFYGSDNCVSIVRGTPVLAAKDGIVIRADLNYRDLTMADLERYNANPNTPEALDAFRGRQVWIDHGGGIITRYAHLDGIAQGITVGTRVAAGQTIGFVGESGTPDSLLNPGVEIHLHFEVWVGDSFLGKDLPPAEVRRLYQALFSP